MLSIKDYFDNEVFVGDEVVFEIPNYKQLSTGKIIRFTPKGIRVQYNDDRFSRPYIKDTFVYQGYFIKVPDYGFYNFNKLADLYIKDTTCDGQLFCGCRREDCENYKTEECRKCLVKHLNKMENN